MEPARPEFVPAAGLSREAMEALQRDVAAAARFEDDVDVAPRAVALEEPVEAPPVDTVTVDAEDRAGPIVAGVDQAFLDDRAVSVVVAIRGGAVVEVAHAVAPLEIPYIPGLLTFREGGPILAAFDALRTVPDLVLFDGSGRIHFREAGIATHLGVVLDVPSIGVAKRLLCGDPAAPVDALPAGATVAIEADGRVEADPGTVIGYAVQTRQFEGSRRINPVYVSPGHRVGPETAATLVLALSAGYKLPEPTRLADAYADEVKATIAD